jgi:hypothetical protein
MEQPQMIKRPLSLEEFSKTFLGIDITPKQKEWVDKSDRMVNILRPGNQFGKTTIEAIKHIYQAFTKPRLSKFALNPEGWLRTEYPTLNFGKTYEIAKAVFYTMIDIINGDFLIYNPITQEAHVNDSKITTAAVEIKENPLPFIRWWNNSITMIRSYDDLGTSFKAKKIAFISGDEVGDIPNLILFMNATLLPRLAFFQGNLDLVGTPQELGDYQELVELAWKGNQDYFLMGGTMYDNTHLNPQYVKKIEDIADPDLRRRMIYGEFVESGERFFPIMDIMNACKLDVVPPSGFLEDPVPTGRYVLSYDPAAANDNAAIGVIRYDCVPYRIAYLKIFKGNSIPLPMQYSILISIFKKYKDMKCKIRFIYDEGGLGGKNVKAYLTELNGYGFPGEGHSYAETKADSLARLKDVLERGRETRIVDGKEVDMATQWGGLHLPNDRSLRIELEGYKLDDKKIKNDQVMMLSMAIWYIERLKPRLVHKSAIDFDMAETIG